MNYEFTQEASNALYAYMLEGADRNDLVEVLMIDGANKAQARKLTYRYVWEAACTQRDAYHDGGYYEDHYALTEDELWEDFAEEQGGEDYHHWLVAQDSPLWTWGDMPEEEGYKEFKAECEAEYGPDDWLESVPYEE